MFICKGSIGQLPLYLSSLLLWNFNSQGTRSHHWLTPQVPHVTSDLRKTVFCFSAPHTWNTLQKTFMLLSWCFITVFQDLILSQTEICCNCDKSCVNCVYCIFVPFFSCITCFVFFSLVLLTFQLFMWMLFSFYIVDLHCFVTFGPLKMRVFPSMCFDRGLNKGNEGMN